MTSVDISLEFDAEPVGNFSDTDSPSNVTEALNNTGNIGVFDSEPSVNLTFSTEPDTNETVLDAEPVGNSTATGKFEILYLMVDIKKSV